MAANNRNASQSMEGLGEVGATPLLGTLVGSEYIVSIFASPDGPRYTVRNLSGKLIQADLPADDVYRAFPTLDIQGMRVDPPPGTRTTPIGALMLAEPRD